MELVYYSQSLISIGYTGSDFTSDREARKLISGYVYLLGGGVVCWRSVRHDCFADSTSKAKYVGSVKTH